MESRFKQFITDIYKFLTNRVVILIVLFFAGFYALVLQFFDLQIVNSDKYEREIKENRTKEFTVNAPRGTIYDRYGRPLALNELTYTVKIDTSVKPDNATEAYIRLVELMEENEESLIDDFPITTGPFSYTLNDSTWEWWKKNMNIPLEPVDEGAFAALREESGISKGLSENEARKKILEDNPEGFQKYLRKLYGISEILPESEAKRRIAALDAERAFNYLREFFKLPEDMKDSEAAKVLNLLSAVYMERFNLNPITIAFNVKQETVVTLEEMNHDFPGIYVDVDYLRLYPENELFSHILGYIRKASEEDLALYKDYGYTADDLVGKTGIERSFEVQLNGKSGKVTAEIDSSGRRVGTVSEEAPVPGDKIFLTTDRDMTEKIYNLLENMLRKILVGKMKGTAKEKPITDIELVVSMFKANNASFEKIMESEEGSYSYFIKTYVEDKFKPAEGMTPENPDYVTKQAEFFYESVEGRKISVSRVLLAMSEQEIITLTEQERSRLESGRENTKQLLIGKIESGEISPQQTDLMPSTGSVVLVDIDTGDVISAVGYPSYDNNQLVNSFNNEYYQKLNSDPTTPMVNRPFNEPRAPGSAFKMVTGFAGLENGIITPQTRIYDRNTFTDAGPPFPNDRNSYHGNITVMDALKVSCNYFFYDVAYRLGNTKNNNKLEGIAKFNETMIKFGLNDRTGVEIGEYYDGLPEEILKVSSPSLKKFKAEQRGFGDIEWVDGDTVRTGIGQGFSNYTCASMAKYIATIASRGARYQFHLLNRIESYDGSTISVFEPNLETQLDIKPEYFDAIIEGMRRVTQEPGGTARSVFLNFPIKVAGKTGTAQENADYDHTTFGGFAPFDDPQIAIFVIIPYGDTRTVPAAASQLARDVIGEYFGLNAEPELTANNNKLAR